MVCYGLARSQWQSLAAGCLAALSTLTYPAMSALVSKNAAADQQGAAQGARTPRPFARCRKRSARSLVMRPRSRSAAAQGW